METAMSNSSPLVARFNRLERLARTANGLPRNSLRDAGALDAATITEPVTPLVQAEVVTDESGHQFVLGLANVRGQWIAARYEIVWQCVISDVGKGRPAKYRNVELTKRPRSEAVLGGH
jgi:hypothetical protein